MCPGHCTIYIVCIPNAFSPVYSNFEFILLYYEHCITLCSLDTHTFHVVSAVSKKMPDARISYQPWQPKSHKVQNKVPHAHRVLQCLGIRSRPLSNMSRPAYSQASHICSTQVHMEPTVQQYTVPLMLQDCETSVVKHLDSAILTKPEKSDSEHFPQDTVP